MIQEDYVSFETAKLLKDKGFDEECNKVIHQDTKNEYYFGNYSDETKGRLLLVPTQQMACKWLRIKYNIHVEPTPYVTTDGFFWAYKIFGGIIAPNVIPLPNYCVKRLKEKSGFFSCEQATEAAIKYCLEHLI